MGVCQSKNKQPKAAPTEAPPEKAKEVNNLGAENIKTLNKQNSFYKSKLEFTQKELQKISVQEGLENYFLDAVYSEKEQICFNILNHNFENSRATVASVMNLNNTVQKTPYVSDVSGISLKNLYGEGSTPRNMLNIKTKFKEFKKFVDLWNPILIMIAKNQQKLLEKLLITRGQIYLHFKNILSKPYSKDIQILTAFTNSKKIKRESFGLKIAIYNQNEDMLKLLLNGQTCHSDGQSCDQLSQIWNLAHIIEVLKQMKKVDWVAGVQILFQMRRFKQLVGSLSSPDTFLGFVNALINLFDNEGSLEFKNTLLANMDQPPFIFARIVLGIKIKVPGKTDKLKADHLPFFEREIEQIFEVIGGNIRAIKNEILKLCPNEEEINQKLVNLKVSIMSMVNISKNLPPNSSLEQFQIEDLTEELSDLEPFTYKTSSIVHGILQMGDEQLIDHIFSSGSDCNIRTQILSNNYYELGVILPKIKMDFVSELLMHKSFDRFKLTVHYVMDHLQLKNVIEILNFISEDNEMGFQNQHELIHQLITNPKFISLFRLSLESEKFMFIKDFLDILEDEENFDMRYMNNTDKKRLGSLIKDHKQLNEYSNLLKNGEKFQHYDNNTNKAIKALQEEEILLKQIDFSKEYKQIEVQVKDSSHSKEPRKSKEIQPKEEPPKKEPLNLNLDMAVLIKQQKRDDLNSKRDDSPTQNDLAGSEKDNKISTESEHSAIKTSKSSENGAGGIGEGLVNDIGLVDDKPENDFLEHDSIQIQFEHLNKAQICSAISVAYTEVIQELKESALSVEELQEVLQLYNINPFDHVQININTDEGQTERDSPLHPDKYLWNLLLFAIHYNQVPIVEHLLSLKELDPMAIQRPPSSNQEFHIQQGRHTSKQLGIELAVKGQNLGLFETLYEKFSQTFNCQELCEISKTIDKWGDGMKTFLKSDVTKLLFSHFRPEDKEMFVQAVIEPMLSEQPMTKMVIKELKSTPYVSYAVLRYPSHFQKYGILDKSLTNITDNDIITFISAKSDNLSCLIEFNEAFEQKKQTKNQAIREIIKTAQSKQANEQLIEPFDPRQIVQCISQGDIADFMKIFKGLKDKLLFKYIGHQIEADQQVHEVEAIPQDEMLMQILYEMEDVSQSSQNGVEILKRKVIQTDAWNPLIFAIYFGQYDIVLYILKQMDTQCLYYLLSDTFKVDTEDGDESEYLHELSELVPLIICLITRNPEIFKLLWNQTMLWNKQIYLILLGNYVFETQTPSLIRAFLMSQKTRSLYNSISLCEKQKFIQFTIKSLEQQIVGDSDSLHDLEDEGDPQVRKELEQILNIEFLSQPPYSLVNLTENLIPLSFDSTFSDLKTIIEQYQSSPESLEILELTLKNLQGGQETPQFCQKWILKNTNQIWAKKLCSLILELLEEEPNLEHDFRCLEILMDDIFEDMAINHRS